MCHPLLPAQDEPQSAQPCAVLPPPPLVPTHAPWCRLCPGSCFLSLAGSGQQHPEPSTPIQEGSSSPRGAQHHPEAPSSSQGTRHHPWADGSQNAKVPHPPDAIALAEQLHLWACCSLSHLTSLPHSHSVPGHHLWRGCPAQQPPCPAGRAGRDGAAPEAGCSRVQLAPHDLSQLPTPHVHSTPAPPPGPSQLTSHASMASAPSSTPAPSPGTVSSFALSLWLLPSPAAEAPQEDPGPALHRGRPCHLPPVPSRAPAAALWAQVAAAALRGGAAGLRAAVAEPGLQEAPSTSAWPLVAAAACALCPCEMLSLCPVTSHPAVPMPLHPWELLCPPS
ncbi:uncharacterized protein LOC128899612 [Dryobates pubescens]|uniref:uncharacterized protein LOC128899612 n=1 Tax=Dryobates pubescens TaxID=118200 RepID=UPI0023B8DA94|nr:uncharacterized protein LOC128899612 [Dryobates pubescens]